MKIKPFALERYFAKHEFTAKYLLSCSDCEPLSLHELLQMADTEMIRLWKSLKLSYTETLGHPALRESIADIYQGINANEILVTVPEEGIFLLMQALLEPGDHVICTFPGYQSLFEIARSIGCDVSMWETNESQGWHFDIRELEKMIRDNTRLVVINFPHNPTGFFPTKEEYESLVELVHQGNIYLLSDEMYRFLELNKEARLPAGCELYHNAISLSGLSKSFGLPGLRIGWIATQNHEILDRVSICKDYTTICNSAPSEILGLIAMRCHEEIIAKQREGLHHNITVLDKFFYEYKDWFQWHKPLAGSICFPRLLISHNTFEFCETVVNETGIMLVPSRIFQYGDHHIRFGFGRKNMPEVIDRFADYFDRYLKQYA